MTLPENVNELSVFPGAERPDPLDSGPTMSAWFNGCGCWTCTSERVSKLPYPMNMSMPFIACPTCGNKRCPKATQHDQDCSGSNETGQTGSRFGGLKEES